MYQHIVLILTRNLSFPMAASAFPYDISCVDTHVLGTLDLAYLPLTLTFPDSFVPSINAPVISHEPLEDQKLESTKFVEGFREPSTWSSSKSSILNCVYLLRECNVNSSDLVRVNLPAKILLFNKVVIAKRLPGSDRLRLYCKVKVCTRRKRYNMKIFIRWISITRLLQSTFLYLNRINNCFHNKGNIHLPR